MKNKLRSNKGSVTTFVVVTLMVLIVMIMSIYMYNANKHKANLQVTKNIKSVYEESVTNVDTVYAEMILDLVKGITASDIVTDITQNNNASKYYGKYVDYEPKGVSDIGWRIFYIGKDPVNEGAGTGENNIYLIADHYVPREELPAYNTTVLPKTGDNGYGSRTAYFANNNSLSGTVMEMDNIEAGNIISNNLLKNWLSIYMNALNGGASENVSINAVAYMMDTRVWSKFAVSGATKYVLGGPTLEMFTKSWNQTHSSQTLTPTANTIGYYIDTASGLADTTNLWIPVAQYNANVTTEYTEYTEKEAWGMWLASPSYTGNLWNVGNIGSVNDCNYFNTSLGFRPIVCLESSAQLSTNDGGDSYQIVDSDKQHLD